MGNTSRWASKGLGHARIALCGALALWGSLAVAGEGPEPLDPVGALSTPSFPRPCAEILASVLQDSFLAARTMVLARPGDTLALSWAELVAAAPCLEGLGGFTTTTGRVIRGTWAGISLPDLLGSWAGLQEKFSLSFAADDGYRMAFGGHEILDRSQGTWILALLRDGAPIPEAMGTIRAIKVGPSTPMVDGHLSVQRLSRISVTGLPLQPYSVAMRGKMPADVDRQTLQSCASCHGARVRVTSPDSSEYRGVPVFYLLAYSDDSLYAPHRQDSSRPSYRRDLARQGYTVMVEDDAEAAVTFDSRQLDGQDRVILAMYRDGVDLLDDESPLLVDAVDSASPAMLRRVRKITLRLP